jgi:hypothetical protein
MKNLNMKAFLFQHLEPLRHILKRFVHLMTANMFIMNQILQKFLDFFYSSKTS